MDLAGGKAVKVHKMKWAAAAMLLGFPTAAMAQDAATHRCVVQGGKHDVRIVDGEWYERRPAETSEWTAKGCGTTGVKDGTPTKIVCAQDGGSYVAATGKAGCCGTTVSGQALDTNNLRYAFHYRIDPKAETMAPPDMAGDCAVLESEDARPIDAWPLSKKIANGMPFVIATKEGGLKLRPGDWKYPERHSYFLTFTGKYYPDTGTWSVSAVGFDPHRVNSYHSCAPYELRPKHTRCGGIHQEGHSMDRWYKPEEHDLAAFGYAYTFDEAGTVFFEGKPVAAIMVPNL